MAGLSDLGMTFNYRHGAIRVFKTVITALNNPKYVFFALSDDCKTLSVYGTEENNINCLLVKRHLDNKGADGLKLHGQVFIKRIGGGLGWDLERKYIARGHLNSAARCVAFDLTKAEPD